jgi:hypothetical protein
MKSFSRISVVVFGVVVTVLTMTLPGCQTGHTYSRNGEGSTSEHSRGDGRPCQFG